MKRLLAFFLTATMLFTLCAFPIAADGTQPEFRALYLDLFSSSLLKKGTTENEISDYIDEAVEFADENGFSALFVRAVTSAGASYTSDYLPHIHDAVTKSGDFDLLGYVVKAAHKKNVQVYAVADVGALEIDGYSASGLDPVLRFAPWTIDGHWDIGVPQVRTLVASYIRELSENYQVDGIMIDNFWYPEDPDDTWTIDAYANGAEMDAFRRDSVNVLLKDMRQAAKAGDETIAFGVATEAVWASKENNPKGSATYGEQSYYDDFADSLSWVESGALDFIVPKIGYSVINDDMSYRAIVEWWGKHKHENTALFTLNMADLVGKDFEKKYELVHQLQINRNNNVDGHIFQSYETLANTENEIMSVIAPLYTKAEVFDMSTDLTVKSGFKCTRPGKSTSVSYSTYYITGLCDPSQPVYMNGEKLSDIGSAGVFGAFVDLEIGANVFTFTQGSQSVTVTVTRKESTSSSTTTKISGMFPSYDDFVYAGKEFTLSCTAPSGGTVTVKLFGKVYTLTQNKEADEGVAVKFSAKITPPEASSANATDEMGKVTYTLKFDGKTKDYTSTGRVFNVGTKAKAIVEIIEPLGLGTVYEKADTDSDVTSYLYTGTQISITGASGSFFTVPMGGYLPKGSVDPVAGKTDLANRFSSAKLKTHDGYEKITLKGERRSPFTATMTEDTLTVTFYDVTDAPKVDVSGSKALAGCTVNVKKDSLVYTFPLKSATSLWGYHVSYEGNNTCITLKYPPRLSSDSNKPLTGIAIIVDPGHGDGDAGAWGTAGLSGPCEKDLNMAVSEKLVQKFKSLGATVYCTRTTDINVDFEGILGFTNAIKPDFFISVHHNSVSVNVDMGKPNGVEVFYHSAINSKVFARNLVDKLHEYTGRAYRGKGAIYADYRVTRLYYCPSVLVEIGFMPNPEEYSEMVKPAMVEKEAQALVDGLLKTMEDYGK